MMSSNKGCFKCQDGYYKTSNGLECDECDESCETCLNENECITCNETYWRKPDTSGLCHPFETFHHCHMLPAFPLP